MAACSLRVVPEGKEVLDMLIVLENSPIAAKVIGQIWNGIPEEVSLSGI